MSKKNQVKFRLFEKNGSIRIAIQTESETDENSFVNTSAEYYIASDPRNVSRILDTLVSTVKDVSIDGDSLCTNYRKNDTFIIEDYQRLRNYPELEPFFNKIGKKIKNQEAKNKQYRRKPSRKRKQIQFRKRDLMAATFMIGVITFGLFKSDHMLAQESMEDTFALDYTDPNWEMEKHEVGEILEKYQASIVENYSSMSDTSSLITSSEVATIDENVPVSEETTEIAMVDETMEASFEEPQDEVFEQSSEPIEEFVNPAPEVSEDEPMAAEEYKEVDKKEIEEQGQEKKEEETKAEGEIAEKGEEKKEQEESTEATTKETTEEVFLTKTEEELDQEIEKIAEDLVAQNKTSEEDVKEAATVALQDGQAPAEVEPVQVETQVATASVTEESTPIVSQNGTGINYIETYHLTPEQIDVIKATIQHEAGFNPIEVEKVASTVINRCESGGWPGGTNPYGVIVGKGQFQSYYAGYYKKYLNGNYAEFTDEIVDAMLKGEQLPSHDFERFASGSSATGVQFTEKGNKYR